ncbi:MAG: permease, partial [Mycobacterium sp.]
NYTTWLNIVFVALAAVLVVRFVTTGGIPMLRMMGGSPDAGDEACGHHHHHH